MLEDISEDEDNVGARGGKRQSKRNAPQVSQSSTVSQLELEDISEDALDREIPLQSAKIAPRWEVEDISNDDLQLEESHATLEDVSDDELTDIRVVTDDLLTIWNRKNRTYQ